MSTTPAIMWDLAIVQILAFIWELNRLNTLYCLFCCTVSLELAYLVSALILSRVRVSSVFNSSCLIVTSPHQAAPCPSVTHCYLSYPCSTALPVSLDPVSHVEVPSCPLPNAHTDICLKTNSSGQSEPHFLAIYTFCFFSDTSSALTRLGVISNTFR